MALADCLVGLVANQLAESGAPFIMGGLLSSFDQKSNSRTFGAPEHGLLSSALVDVCRYLHIPNYIMGGCTDSKILDAQGSMEAAFFLLSGGLSGANIIQGCNVLESGDATSLDLLVMSNEIMGMVKRILRGIEVEDETMAVDVVDEVGPGGHFLGSEHTIMNFRSETWWPTLMNRKRYDDWCAGGKKTLAQRTNEKTQEILKNHQSEPLPEETIAKINEVLAQFDQQGCGIERGDSHEI
ncbi:MAG: trimethylamine methyltransferase family protein, partial [Dehalobacterium sp.]